ncbi:hypothetical protein AA12717_3028 [Gluconacetobacter sacchari DSM 12717]|nr:DUF2840 domain-containing protein [Gluconacetobacter sacchari]GBQ28703.1 hypothetical protein AA12717_3028 [Gluconacetobacter sacchari DSM 12717]
MTAMDASDAAALGLTTVELTFVEKRVEHWLRFGRPVSDKVLDKRRRLVAFAPGSVFGFIRWAANDYGTVVSCFDIVRAVEPGAAFQTVPFVRPGGELLLDVSGWPKVRRMLEEIDAIEELGLHPAEICPDHWRVLNGRIAANVASRPYTLAMHKAWLARKRLAS